ncbi:MAG: hypothetical protein D3906_16950, partial [Candidatus Electrothrix sp. AUS1_2]|nr:hypothetical protein [Candidatus Electrothrix sp. AUS1_2]
MSILIRKTLSPLVLLCCCTLCLFVAQAPAEDGEQHIVNAACDLQYASQKIAKSYFYKELDIRYESAVRHMQDGLADFDRNIPILQQGIKSKEEESIMKFLLSSYEQLKEILPKPYSNENGSMIIDASESIFEAADFLAKEHLPKDSGTEDAGCG